jgi:hypothetical protein
MEKTSKFKNVARWILLFPGSIIAAYIAWLIVTILNRITMLMAGIYPDSLLYLAYIEISGHLVMGSAFVYIGARIAPYRRKESSCCLAGLGLILVGAVVFIALLSHSYWHLLAHLSLASGLGVTAFAIATDKLKIQ